MNTRRELLRKLGISVAVTATPVGAALVARPALRQQVFDAMFPLDGAPGWMRPALCADTGGELGLGWAVQSLSAIDRGAMVLSLSHADGRTARVHLCTHDGQPRGLAHTELLDFILMDGGQGDLPTEEDLGRVLLSLADRLGQQELEGLSDLFDLASLQTHDERMAQYGPETLV